MPQHLQRDLAKVKRHVLEMGAMVENGLACARGAFQSGDASGIAPLEQLERAIDDMQMEIDDEILKVLALHQPMAGDLRSLMAALKIVNDLERIGDLTASIASRLGVLLREPGTLDSLELCEMMDGAASMLQDSLHAFVSLDSQKARSVLAKDDEIDEMNTRNFERLVERMKREPGSVDLSVALLSVSRSVERIADLATNIAEDVVFIVDGEDIRHAGPPAESK